MKLAVRIKYFWAKSKKRFNHSHLKTNTALRIKFHSHYVFTKMLIFSYNNAQIHPNGTVQYFLKSVPFEQKAQKRALILRVPTKYQLSFQTKGFIHGLVQTTLKTCERAANIFYSRVQIIHICLTRQWPAQARENFNITFVWFLLFRAAIQ